MDAVLSVPQNLMDGIANALAANPEIIAWYTTVVRFLFPILALLIHIRTFRSLLTVPTCPRCGPI